MGREKVIYLSDYARRALAKSAEKIGVTLGRLEKDDQGAPLPSGGMCWSLSHKSAYVAGVVAPGPVGVDVEKVRPVSAALQERVALPEEWQLGDPDDEQLFFRYWTAKEAVIKATGAGFREFSDCRIQRIIDHRELVVCHREKEWIVEQIEFDGHFASVVKAGWEVAWELERL